MDASAIDAYVARLVTNGVALRGLGIDETPLEELFFMLTEPGRSDDPTRTHREAAP